MFNNNDILSDPDEHSCTATRKHLVLMFHCILHYPERFPDLLGKQELYVPKDWQA